MPDEARESLTATHHALLFAWLAREVIVRAGEKRGTAAIRQAVRRYGMQRGRRMALRAQADGRALSMASFLAYGEWAVDPAEMESVADEGQPDRTVRVYRCPWYTAWVENDLLAYGRLYCLDIDEALVRGFNPELRIDVNRTRPYDGEYCEHVFHDVGEMISRGGEVMPWNYHAGHLCRTMGEVIAEQLGEVGCAGLRAALAAFSERYGAWAAQVVEAYGDTDFDQLPG
jgi:hypothetical protein